MMYSLTGTTTTTVSSITIVTVMIAIVLPVLLGSVVQKHEMYKKHIY